MEMGDANCLRIGQRANNYACHNFEEAKLQHTPRRVSMLVLPLPTEIDQTTLILLFATRDLVRICITVPNVQGMDLNFVHQDYRRVTADAQIYWRIDQCHKAFCLYVHLD